MEANFGGRGEQRHKMLTDISVIGASEEDLPT